MRQSILSRNAALALLTLFAALQTCASHAASFQTLHSFAGDVNGGDPQSPLALIGSTLYGITDLGGANSGGTLFSLNTDGSNFHTNYAFSGGDPNGGFTFIGSTLYGTTESSGSRNLGQIYSVNPNGTGFQTVHSFAADGINPYSTNFVQVGSKIFGTARSGGDNGGGTVVSMNLDGSNATLLHSFVGGGSDGYDPWSGLTLAGSTLYGTTADGASSGFGTVFSMNQDGSNFKTVHTFTGGTNGANPEADLKLIGSTLYGTTNGRGTTGGSVFSMNLDGSNFKTLHPFTLALPSDGASPQGLTVAGSILYGVSQMGGDSRTNGGTIFSLNLDGSNFQVLYTFLGTTNGVRPSGALTLANSTLYGTTTDDGPAGSGTVFAISVPEPTSLTFAASALVALAIFVACRVCQCAGPLPHLCLASFAPRRLRRR